MNLEEATMLALQHKLIEAKYMVNRRNWVINNDHEAEYFGRGACWDDVYELNIRAMSDEEKVKAVQQLKDNIDNTISQRADYDEIDSKYIPLWKEAYKSVVDDILNQLALKGKFYIEILVDIEDSGDVDHRGGYISVNNGQISDDVKYYNTKEEARKDLKSISEADYKKYIYDNYVGEYDEVIWWDVRVTEYKPDNWDLR